MDEFHNTSTDRPPGAQQVMDSLDIAPHNKEPLEQIIGVIPDDCPMPQVPLDTLDPTLSEHSRHAKQTADAAVCISHSNALPLADTEDLDDDKIPPLVSPKDSHPQRETHQEPTHTLCADTSVHMDTSESTTKAPTANPVLAVNTPTLSPVKVTTSSPSSPPPEATPPGQAGTPSSLLTPPDEIQQQLWINSLNSTLLASQEISIFQDLTVTQQTLEEVIHLDNNTNMYRIPRTVRVRINRLPTLGFQLAEDPSHCNVYLMNCQEGSHVSRLPRWKQELQHAVLLSVNGTNINSIHQLMGLIDGYRQAHLASVDFTFAKIEPRATLDPDMPQMHYNQLRHVHHLLISEEPPPSPLRNLHSPLAIELNATRAKLKLQEDFDKWLQGEWSQLDKYELQNMFGEPIPWPEGATVLPFVWNYVLKRCPLTGKLIYKARGTCNGGPRYGRAVTMAETYATCVEQPACRMYWALTASQNLLAMGADAGNAFAEAPPPLQKFFMRIDEQFRTWWTQCKGRPLIPKKYVLPVNNALQGHPESPRLWETHIHKILVNELKFTATTHEKCLYSRPDPHTSALQLLLRQVDDFSVSANDQEACTAIISEIGRHLKAPLNDLGIITNFNGTNILQTRWYIKVSCQDYIIKILTSHDWLTLYASNQPLPMRSDSKYQRQLEMADRPTDAIQQKAIQDQAGFSFRMAIGELIYALVIARPEISTATTKLSQYNFNPAMIHYQAVKAIFAFLNDTREDGLIFWRTQPRLDLPDAPLPTPYSTRENALTPLPSRPHTLLGYTDSDWGSDFSHRRSVSGMTIMLSGAAIIYKTKYQRAVALSSTEAEFVSAADAGKMVLYVRSILTDLGLTPDRPTDLHVDNSGAIFMINAQAPTKRTRHVVIRFFALLHWSETQQIAAISIRTDQNIRDSMTKCTGRIKFHQHADMYMGRTPPTYVTNTHPAVTPVYLHALQDDPVQTIDALTHFPPQSMPSVIFLASLYESMGGEGYSR